MPGPDGIRRRIYRRNGKRWIRYVATIELGRDGGSRVRRTKEFERQTDAKAWRAEQLKLMSAGVSVAFDAPTVGALLRSWLEYGEHIAEWSPSHLVRSRHIVEHDLKPLHSIRADRLTAEHVERLLAGRRKAGAAVNSLRLIRNALSAALNLAIRRRVLPQHVNAARLAQLPKGGQEAPRFLAPEQARAFLQALDGDRLRPLFITAMTLALRPGEALGLRWSDVDLDTGTVTIRRSLQYVGREYHELPPKTQRSSRAIALPGALVTVLREHRETQQEELARKLGETTARKHQQDGLVFVNMAGGPIHEPYANRRLAWLLGWERVKGKGWRERPDGPGLPRVTFYQLRHTGATVMLALGVPLEQITELMGHTTQAMTLRYAQIVEPLRREAAARVDAFYRAPELFTEPVPQS